MTEFIDPQKLAVHDDIRYVGGRLVRIRPKQPRERHIVIKQNGREKKYRINKYGELFEE